jgi:hypothetical protein
MKVIPIFLLGLLIVGCTGRKAEVEEIEDAYRDQSSSSVEESISFEGDEVFYEPRDSSDTSESVDEQQPATETTTESSDESKGKVEVIKTNNGDFKLELPSGWQTVDTKELSDNADISVKNSNNETYYMVLSEAKKDFKDFNAFKNSVDISDLGDRSNEKKESIKYNSMKGERRKFTAKKDEVDVYYIYDLMESEDHYLQCISWTLDSKKDANEADMIKLMKSLTEL